MCLSRTSKESEEEKAARMQSKNIESKLKEENAGGTKRHMKLLLLGTGDSGKSTFAKQMSLIHNKGGLSDSYVETFIPILRENCLQGMHQLLRYINDNEGQIPPAIADQVKKVQVATELTPVVASDISEIWKNKQFRELSEKADDAQLQGGVAGVQYYFENAERFGSKDFKPTKDDMLKARRKTTGIVETQFSVGSTQFTMVDVGGQRSERKKWLHCFGSVSSVIFLTAINEFDMVLEEDSKTNRLVESLKLWKALTSSQFFKQTPFILFLNKSDLFKERIAKTPLVDIFSDYEQFSNEAIVANCDSFEKGWKYISRQYQIHFAGSVFYPHLTCALDTNSCQKVFNAVQETLLKEVVKLAEFK